ncbi:hypothetical protein [Mycobacterium marinum]|uniref:hypothetical protein n=1 Tax=Mycobacterium marinum TaxID=1781 RepID=UPI000358B963|nr:hypothetical protein [Mycobacterium marinum]EPQ73194.1 hypothetical protein MMMB2_3966 [Mycobacterium marinum MB2]
MLASKRLAPRLDEFGAALYRSGELVIDSNSPALLVRRSAASRSWRATPARHNLDGAATTGAGVIVKYHCALYKELTFRMSKILPARRLFHGLREDIEARLAGSLPGRLPLS